MLNWLPGKNRATVGAWTRVARTAELGAGSILGDWSIVGEHSIIGENCHFGPWAKIGNSVTLGANVTLGSHTVIQDGVIVPDGTTFEDGDLVTLNGVEPDMMGGFTVRYDPEGALLRAPFGKFYIPGMLHDDASGAALDEMINAMNFGRATDLDDCRLEEEVDQTAMPEI
ncbi:MAG: hypothetical protein ABJN42_07410 [Roseibium sp.]|uniref:hypothetical protein n=1 Tax=Roseibium sp. TaxID=1936156 RepID=UPI003299D788